jgi:hypothetical protein
MIITRGSHGRRLRLVIDLVHIDHD